MRRPTGGALLGLGRPLRLLREAEGAKDVVPEALLAVDDLVDEARLPVGGVVRRLV